MSSYNQVETRKQSAIDACNSTQTEIEWLNGLKVELAGYHRTLVASDAAGEFNTATYHALCQRVNLTPNGHATVIFKDGTEIKAQ